MLKIRNPKQFNIFIFFVCVFSFLFLVFSFCDAAVLYLEPSAGQYQLGDTFGVEIKIDTQECINVVEANLKFPPNILKAIDFSQGNSIITLWVKQPEINQESGLISFSGGIPNGYCGRVLGDPQESNLLGKIIFKVSEITGEAKIDLAEIKFLSSQVLLNDGRGTKAELTDRGAKFKILSKLETPKDQWREEIKSDDIPPEAFEIKISRDSTAFEGKYFITFSTTDKQTGIDHYEMKEGKRDWETITSPYVLKNQGLTNDVLVKAVDKAGNERIETLKALRRPIWEYILYGFLALILISVIIKISWHSILKIFKH